MTDINEIKRELEALTAKVAAYDATKARNWPERIEAGMVFRHGNAVYMVDVSGILVMIHGDQPGGTWIQWERAPLEYLGTSFSVLTIRTDAHEPTGAELVGKVCEFADLMSGPWSPGECAAFGRNPDYPYKKDGGAEWKFARLAK